MILKFRAKIYFKCATVSTHTGDVNASTQQRVEINNQEKSVILRLNREGQNVQHLAAGQTVVVVILSGDINL